MAERPSSSSRSGSRSTVPELLINALRTVAQTGEVGETVESSHGKKYVVDGPVSSQTESNRSRMVRTVWIIDRGLEAPRLVTAYPAKG
jgi:hypothetical protein